MKGLRCGGGRRLSRSGAVDHDGGQGDLERWTSQSLKRLRGSGELAVGGSKVRKVDPAGCEVHRCGGELDSAACHCWGGGPGRGRGGALGQNVGGKEGKTMELPKQPFSVHVAGVKQEYRRAKLLGA